MSTMSELDIECGTSAGGAVTVEDIEGLLALPVGTKLRDSAGDVQVKREDGEFDLYWQGVKPADRPITYFGDEGPEDGDLPATVLNPEILGKFESVKPAIQVGDFVQINVPSREWDDGGTLRRYFQGLRAKIVAFTGAGANLLPLDVRRDCPDYSGVFYWTPLSDLEKLDIDHLFAVGDRVRANESSDQHGRIGTITDIRDVSHMPREGERALLNVEFDGAGLGGGFAFRFEPVLPSEEGFVKPKPVVEDDEVEYDGPCVCGCDDPFADDVDDSDLADWEKEPLESSGPEYEDFTFEVGSRVHITYGHSWDGPATVTKVGLLGEDGVFVQPDHKPDGCTGGFSFEGPLGTIVTLLHEGDPGYNGEPERVERFTINSDELPVVLDLEALEALPKGTVLLESVADAENYPMCQRLDNGSWGRFNYVTSEARTFDDELRHKFEHGFAVAFVAHLPQ